MAAPHQSRAKDGRRSVRLGQFSRLGRVMPQLILASLAINLLSLALPLALLQVYDRIIPNSSLSTLLILVVGVAVALLLELLLRIARSEITSWVGSRFEHMAGCAAFRHILHSRIDAFERDGAGVSIERLAGLRTAKEFYAGQALVALLDLPFVVIFLALIWLLGGPVVYVAGGMLVLYLLFTMVQASALKRTIFDHTTLRDRRLSFSIEVLSGVHTVKSMGMEAQMVQRYDRLLESVAGGSRAVAYRNAATLNIGTLISQLALIAVVAYGATRVIDLQMTVGALAACTLLTGRAMQPLQRAAGFWSRFQTIRLARQRLRAIFSLPSEPHSDHPAAAEWRGALELKDVHFRYGEDGPVILSGASLAVAPGECIGINGINGSGKTSLLALMRGTLVPDSGEVLLDGRLIFDYETSEVRRSGIAYLPQQGELFKGTLLENMTMFRKGLTGKARELARELGLDQVVAKLPGGYHTMIGDAGEDALPRGIRQRVAIVRALVNDPKVVLFDEANTAMDSNGDMRLRAYLEQLKGRVTLIIVSSRPSLLNLGDRRFDLTEGQLIEKHEDGPKDVRPNDAAQRVPA
ncbi:type I secretion system permease/ATPase [Magnetospira thiophila]